MTTQIVIDIANKVKEIDPRVSAYADGSCIKGTFRGKKGEDYCYDLAFRTFKYNNEGPNVRKAIEAAILALNF